MFLQTIIKSNKKTSAKEGSAKEGSLIDQIIQTMKLTKSQGMIEKFRSIKFPEYDSSSESFRDRKREKNSHKIKDFLSTNESFKKQFPPIEDIEDYWDKLRDQAKEENSTRSIEELETMLAKAESESKESIERAKNQIEILDELTDREKEHLTKDFVSYNENTDLAFKLKTSIDEKKRKSRD